ncbi:MAG: binding-protein-dependent transport permease [Clostridia bacterium]|nr:binding-protein-dependent transport permease [Clostridia bacterium]
MKKAILAVVITLLVSLFVMGVFYETLEFGLLAAILIMGGFIIYFNEKKK